MSKYIIEIEEGKEVVMFCQSGIVSIGLHLKDEKSLRGLGIRSAIPYTEPDMEKVREEAFKNGYDAACKDIDIKSKTNAAYQKGYQDATVKISSDEQAIAEKAYQKGLNDAWSFAEHLAYISDDVTNSVYMSMNGGKGLLVAFGMSYEDAKKQYDEYFKKKKEEQESITAEDVMRQYLDTFCTNETGCSVCPLHTPEFTCGRGYSFLTIDQVSDEEVRRAYFTVLAKMKEES